MKKALLFILLFAATESKAINITANEFAQEAGIIAGTVQACSTSVVEYNSRALEAINVLAATASDRQQASVLYANALSKAQDAQTHHHPINCTEAVKSFNSLPLMRADYKTAVLPKLAAMQPTPVIPAAKINVS